MSNNTVPLPITVAIHQPNFFPWLGYFSKIKNSDIFIFLDDTEFSKGSYTNRSRIKVGDEQKWLTLPVQYKSDADIKDIPIGRTTWREKHLASLQGAYKKTPHFNETMPFISDFYNANTTESLATFNISAITKLTKALGIPTKFVVSSTLSVSGKSDERLCNLVKVVGGTRYLSGRGGKNYQSPETYQSADIELAYTTFQSTPYSQLGDEFVAGLSILDVLFNLGFDGAQALLESA